MLSAAIEGKRKVEGGGNVRTVMSPKVISKVVKRNDWVGVGEMVSESELGLRDGFWEVGDTVCYFSKW